MFTADYHCHSDFSSDGHDPISALLASAEARGLTELCVTDHCDLVSPPDIDAYLGRLEHARAAYAGSVRLLFGLELGEGSQFPTEARAIASRRDWDFIIGSLHQLRGQEDFYFLRYKSETECYDMLDAYFRELYDLTALGDFDVLGHLSYPLRYMSGRDGFRLDLIGRYETQLRRIFALLRDTGKGLEVNLSGLYKQGYWPEALPGTAVLRLYRETGGQIVTLGSDAHRAEQIGSALTEGLEICREAGFGRIAAYAGRNVRYESI